MGAQGSVTRLIIDIRSHEPAVRELAARLVWGRYFQELLLLARNHLAARIRCREDEEDVLPAFWKLEGYTNQEIARQLDCALSTVERKLERIQAYWAVSED